MDDIINTIKANVQIINKTATDDALLTYVIAETIDRVRLYLNRDDLPQTLYRVIARVASSVYNQTMANVENSLADQAVSSMSDNGQSISYSNEAKNYLATQEDGELFGGFAKLLAPYRRVNVVSDKC